jgi:uncharacterized membrane protein required for colicin V production
MDTLQRLQPLDVLFAIIWAGVVGWGLQTGVLRQLGMLVGVYGAALLAGSVYRPVGQALALAFGRGNLPVLEFVGYVAVFVLTFGFIGVLIWRAYPLARLGRQFGLENVLGAALAAVWGVMLLIVLLTILRFYTAVPWREQEANQQGVQTQVRTSQVAPVLEVVTSPLWNALVPWFPSPVTPRS